MFPLRHPSEPMWMQNIQTLLLKSVHVDRFYSRLQYLIIITEDAEPAE